LKINQHIITFNVRFCFAETSQALLSGTTRGGQILYPVHVSDLQRQDWAEQRNPDSYRDAGISR